MTNDMILKLRELTYKHFHMLWEIDEYGDLDPLFGEEDMMLGSRRIVNFKCSNILKDRVNGKG